MHRYLTASPYDTVDVDCGPVVKHKTMAKFRDSLEIEDKIGFVHHSKPRKYGETKNNKVQRMVDKLERNYMIPSKSYWRNTPTQPIPELLIKPIGGKSVENQDQTGLERFKIDMRNPYSLEVLENIIPLPKDVNGKFGEYIEIPRQAHKTFASNIELAKIRKEEFQKNKIESIKKADLERMRLAQNCPPKYKKEIESQQKIDEINKKSQTSKNDKMAKKFYNETPKRDRDRPKSTAVNMNKKQQSTDIMQTLSPAIATIFRDLRREVDIPAFKQSDHLKRAIENASRKLIKIKQPLPTTNTTDNVDQQRPTATVNPQNRSVRFSVAADSQVDHSRIDTRMKASRHQQSKSTAAESRLVYHDDDCESVASHDGDSFTMVDGGPLAGDMAVSVDSDVEDVGSHDGGGVKWTVRFAEEGVVGDNVCDRRKRGERDGFDKDEDVSLTKSKVSKLYDQVFTNSRRIKDMRLLDLLKMQKDKATNSKELHDTRKDAILRQCRQLETLIKSQASFDDIEAYIGDK